MADVTVEPAMGDAGGAAGGAVSVGILDVVIIAGLVAVVAVLVMRFRRKKLEEQNTLRSLKVMAE